MSSVFDTDALFDQQTSILLQKSQQRTQQPTQRTQSLNATPTSIVDNIANRVSSLEERLNACDSIYRLAAQANTLREKDRRDQYQAFIRQVNGLDQRLVKAEEQVFKIPDMIKAAVNAEMQQYDNTKMVTTMLEQASAKMTDRITDLDAKFSQANKKTQKQIKKLRLEAQLAKTQPEDDGRVDDLSQQLLELKRRQSLMFDLMNAMKSHDEQDFNGVNSQLTGLWTQLATKRAESPLRRTE